MQTVIGLTVVVGLLAGCGNDLDRDATPSAVETSPTNLITGQEKILIKTYAELLSVVDTGKVLDGSSLGDSPFCPEGTFSGGHGNTDNGWLDKTFECPEGTLRIAFDPRHTMKRSASGPWEVLSGTGAYQGMEGSGRFVVRFSGGQQAPVGHEMFTGTVSQ